MASFLDRFLGPRDEAVATAPGPSPESTPRPRRRPLPQPGRLRRERRALLRLREERIRDLGGVVLEMYRRDRFREDLLFEQAAELLSIEERLQELDALLAAVLASRRTRPAARCACGAPVIWGTHFCGNCGRPVGAAPVVTCAVCGHALQADAQFCPSCGTRAGEGAEESEPVEVAAAESAPDR